MNAGVFRVKSGAPVGRLVCVHSQFSGRIDYSKRARRKVDFVTRDALQSSVKASKGRSDEVIAGSPLLTALSSLFVLLQVSAVFRRASPWTGSRE